MLPCGVLHTHTHVALYNEDAGFEHACSPLLHSLLKEPCTVLHHCLRDKVVLKDGNQIQHPLKLLLTLIGPERQILSLSVLRERFWVRINKAVKPGTLIQDQVSSFQEQHFCQVWGEVNLYSQ